MKRYKAIFFDWDGTAVQCRHADPRRVLAAMERVLLGGTILVIVSGTTYGNLCEGRLEELLSVRALQNLYLGLARGNYDYAYNAAGKPFLLTDSTPNQEMTLRLHDAVYALHRRLLSQNRFLTDIVFSRPNYCKVDLMVENARAAESLFLQESEVGQVNALLAEHEIEGGLSGLLTLAEQIGSDMGLQLKATTDAKYLEVGYTTKSDNVNRLMDILGLDAKQCCFWGDEFGAIAPGIWGSDSQMITDTTRAGEFFSVSDLQLPLPENVQNQGGGVERFLSFLEEYALYTG